MRETMTKTIYVLLFLSFFTSACHQQNQKNISSDIKPFLQKYFNSWSKNDMKSYRSCFHKDAVIVYIKNGTVANKQNLRSFIKGQSSYLATAAGKVRESMTSFSATEDDKSAAVIVKWLFEEKGKPSGTGIDHFLLIRDKDKKWKIVSLVWYKD